MSGFAADWLGLREPLDAVSRAMDLGAAAVAALAQSRPRAAPVAVIDLGAGTGANLRYAAPLLGGAQEWLLVDSDPVLLAAMEGCMQDWARYQDLQWCAGASQITVRGARFACSVRSTALDLATQLQQLPMGGGALLTAAALLDLVSEEWLRDLARRAAAAAATVWFALTYDGRMHCFPEEPEDAEARHLFNLHQLQDKGFGPALGPAAGSMTQQILVEHGYEIQCAPSDWRLGPEQRALQHALVTGWFDAACAVAPHRAVTLRGWLARRRTHIEGGRSELRVGHVDIMGRPRQHYT